MSYSYYDDYYPRRLTVGEQRQAARKKSRELEKSGEMLEPLPDRSEGRQLVKTFWGKAWCQHLESFSDYANRLGRGRSYARNGQVIHLGIEPGFIYAMVMGSELYEIMIRIEPLPKGKWESIQKACRGKIASLVALLRGEISDEVMQVVANRETGLFPSPKEIRLDCNCPDYADLCKHLAAVLYGVGIRLDEKPELLFVLRGVDHEELLVVEKAAEMTRGRKGRKRLNAAGVKAIFGIELDVAMPKPRRRKRTR